MTGNLDPAIISEVALFRDLHSEQLSKLAARLHQKMFPSAKDSNTAKVPDSSVSMSPSASATNMIWKVRRSHAQTNSRNR
jgi:hypothetical protein